MVTLDEMKLQRELLSNKCDHAIRRVNQQMQANRHVAVEHQREDLLTLLQKFEVLHIQIVAKERLTLDDPEPKQMLEQVTTKIDSIVDTIDDYLYNRQSVEEQLKLEKKYEELAAASTSIIKELEELEKSLSWIQQSKDGEFRTDMMVVSSAIASSDQELEKCKEMEAYILEHETSSDKRKTMLDMMLTLNMNVKDRQRRLRSYISRSQSGSARQSRQSSPTRTQEQGAGGLEGGGGADSVPTGTDDGGGTRPPEENTEGHDDDNGSEHSEQTGEDAEIVHNPDGNDQMFIPHQPYQRQEHGVRFHNATVGGMMMASGSAMAGGAALGGLTSAGAPLTTGSSARTAHPSMIGGPGSSSTGSGGRPSSRLSTVSSQGVLRAKRLDFPKFSGGLREYNIFKKDFQMVVEQSREYTETQLSLVLRNECLSGAAKRLVANIYDYGDIWRKLDENYDDEGQIVSLITDQILSSKPVAEENMEGFIEYAEMIEKAYYDLSAYGSTDVLANPMTVQAILTKCPLWVQQSLTMEMAKKNVPRTREFEFIRLSLIQLKKQARTMKKLRGRATDGRKVGRGTVNVAEGDEADPADVVAAAVIQKVKPKAGSGSWKCYVPDCKYTTKHMFHECRAFKKLDPNGRGEIVLKRKLCVVCFSNSHEAKDCPKKSTWRQCDVGGCGGWHSRLLHGATVSGLVLAAAGSIRGSLGSAGETLLLIQDVPVLDCEVKCVVFWDPGATTNLVKYGFAEQCGLSGKDCSFSLTGVGGHQRVFNTKLYTVPLVDRWGRVHRLQAFGIEQITSSGVNRRARAAAEAFGGVGVDEILEDPGEVDLLIGMTEVSIMPVRQAVKSGLALFTSQFGSGKLLGGVTSGECFEPDSVMEMACVVAKTEPRGVTMDFLSSEAFGVDAPRRCSTCKGCKECKFKNTQISYEEMTELTHIENNLKLDVKKKKWIADYSYKQDPCILKDNYTQAFACMTSLEKRLKKNDQVKQYDDQFNENVHRGVFKKITWDEAKKYTGPVNYISIVEAYKEGPHSTTPIRLCMNSSMRFNGVSLNDVLMKGPAALNDILSVTLGFRSYQVAVVKDISKFYQSVLVGERDQHLRRVLHRPGGRDGDPDVYVTMTANFGDKIAGCVAQCALNSTAKTFSDINPEAARRIISDSYVDDTITGAKDRESAVIISRDIDEIASMGGFHYKETVMSGDGNGEDEPRKVLGLGWNSQLDTVYVGTKVNVSRKRKGLKELPDIELEQLVEKFPVILTKRMVWRVVLGQYDILGLISVFTIRMKLIMKKLVEEMADVTDKRKWDMPVSEKIREDFIKVLKQLLVLRNTQFPRCVIPAGRDESKLPEILIMADGSQLAYCALAYLRVQMTDGSYQCRLIMGKTRVAPTKKISVPRMELMAALMAVRLARTVQDGLRFETEKRRYFFTDSSAVLGMLQKPSGAFQEFVGTRVGEITSKSDVTQEWFWIPTAENLADMGTRETVQPEHIGPGSDYQMGRVWMTQARESWPTSQTPGKIPQDELAPAARICHVQVTEQEKLFTLSKFRTLEGALRRIAGVAAALPKLLKAKEVVSSVDELRLVAEHWLVRQHQASVRVGLSKGDYTTLRAELVCMKGLFREVEIVVTAGRLGDKLLVGYDKAQLPILEATSELARLYMLEAHETDHGGVDRTLQRSRNKVWIIHGRKLSKKIVTSCYTCKVANKSVQGQSMAPVHENRVCPTAIFDWTAVDLFGPLSIRDTVKRRVTAKCWGVIFCCTTTSAVHIEVTESYNTDTLLQSMKRFINTRGAPRHMISDPGSQVIAAAEITKTWCYDKITEWAGQRRITWHRIPANSQHYNGCAEAMVKLVKKQLDILMHSRNFTKGEMDTLFSDVAQIINSRPLVKRAGSDPGECNPITPNHLMLGRATVEVPVMNFEENSSLTKRVAFIERVKREFWTKWITQVFPQLLHSYKWNRQHRNVMVGDVVLIKKDSELSNSYRLGVVKEAVPGADGKVRKAVVAYRLVDGGENYRSGGYKEHTTERAVHGLVVVVPVDLQPDSSGPGPRP